MRLNSVIKFQKTLALAAAASNEFEAAAAELAARRMMDTYGIDPTAVPNASLYNRVNFADNALLKQLRAEWWELHPVEVPAKRQRITNLNDWSIPFDMSGYRKHANNKKGGKKGRQSPVRLTYQDHEQIRLYLNEGWTLKQIAQETGFRAETINATRAYHTRSGKWRTEERDVGIVVNNNSTSRLHRKFFYWAEDQFQAPTNPEPTEANSVENESTLVP